MRILISSCPLYGHVNTVLPLALAAQRAGHEVVVATGSDMTDHVARFRLGTWPVGPTHAEAGGNQQESWLTYFAATGARRAHDLVPRAIDWQPDWVIHEETELAGPVVAALTGARHAVHGLGLMPPSRIWQPFAAGIEDIGRLWRSLDGAATLQAATYLHICPPALQPTDEAMWRTVQPLRPAAGLPVADERLAAGIASLSRDRPTVHLTLGTVFHEAHEVLAQAIAGLCRLPVHLIVTVGPAADPARFGPQPAHVHIARYLPHALLLPRCDLVVSQGGAGILFGALAHGLPQLVLPQGADQFMNAQACCDCGAGLSLTADQLSADAIAASAERLLREPAFRTAARRVQAQIQAMPDADAVVETLLSAPQSGSWQHTHSLLPSGSRKYAP